MRGSNPFYIRELGIMIPDSGFTLI